MEFLEGSRGVYRPIRVLFDTPIYDRALQICWNITSYKSQIALVRELLSLQQKNQIPSQVTAEDMIDLLLEQSKSTLRERLWEFELEDFDEEDAKPLLMLVWAVNVSNKMRDVEFEAQMLLNSPEALPPRFQHPKVLSMAKDYAKILIEKQKEAPSSKLLCPKEVVFEVIPRVLQGFWVLSPRTHLNMPSQKLSKMSVGVTKAVLDRVSNALTCVERQASFSRSMRDDMVLSILTKIRQTHPYDVLVNRIKSFAPVLLSEIVDVAVGQIRGMFQSQSPKVPAHLTTVEPPATAPVQDDSNLAVTEELPAPCPETNTADVSLPPASPTPPDEPPSITDVDTREDENDKPYLENDKGPTREPNSAAVPASPTPPDVPPSSTDVEAREDENDKPYLENDKGPNREPNSAAVPASPTPPDVPPSSTDVEAREDENDKPYLENDKDPTIEPDSAAVPVSPAPPDEPPSSTDVEAREDDNDLESDREPTRETDYAALPAPLTPLAPPVIISAVQDVLNSSLAETEQPTSSLESNSAEGSPPPAPLTPEPPCIPDVQDREDTNEKPVVEEGPKPSREPASPAVPASSTPLTPPLEPVVIVIEVKEKRAQGFFRRLFRSLCCCCK